MSGFLIRQVLYNLDVSWIFFHCYIEYGNIVPHNTKPEHISGDRGEAAHGGAPRRGEHEQNRTSTRRFAQNTNVPLIHQTIEQNSLGLISGRMYK